MSTKSTMLIITTAVVIAVGLVWLYNQNGTKNPSLTSLPQAKNQVRSGSNVNRSTPSQTDWVIETLGSTRGVQLETPTLTGTTLRVAGTMTDTRWVEDILIGVTNLNAVPHEENMREFRAPLQGSAFSMFVPLELGQGQYRIVIQAPILQAPEVDNISNQPVASLQVTVGG